MSTILKALQRLERERPREPAAPFDGRDVVAPAGEEGAPDAEPAAAAVGRARAPWVALAAALVLAAAVLSYRLAPSARGPAAPDGEVADAAASAPVGGAAAARGGDVASRPEAPPGWPEGVPLTLPAPSASEAAPGASVAGGPGAEAPAARRAPAVPGPSAAPSASARAAASERAASPAPAASPPASRPPATASAPPDTRAPAAAARVAPAPAPARGPAPAHAAPPRAAAPPSAVAAAPPAASPPARAPAPAPAKPDVAVVPAPPDVVVRGTVWHPQAERRRATVEVEGHREPLELREGDAVGALVVAKIEPSGVVFLHGGATLRRAVGEAR